MAVSIGKCSNRLDVNCIWRPRGWWGEEACSLCDTSNYVNPKPLRFNSMGGDPIPAERTRNDHGQVRAGEERNFIHRSPPQKSRS